MLDFPPQQMVDEGAFAYNTHVWSDHADTASQFPNLKSDCRYKIRKATALFGCCISQLAQMRPEACEETRFFPSLKTCTKVADKPDSKEQDLRHKFSLSSTKNLSSLRFV